MRSMSLLFSWQQTKRKLEDAAKRLGYLYDKLREQSVRTRTQRTFYSAVDDGNLALMQLNTCFSTWFHLGAQSIVKYPVMELLQRHFYTR